MDREAIMEIRFPSEVWLVNPVFENAIMARLQMRNGSLIPKRGDSVTQVYRATPASYGDISLEKVKRVSKSDTVSDLQGG